MDAQDLTGAAPRENPAAEPGAPQGHPTRAPSPLAMERGGAPAQPGVPALLLPVRLETRFMGDDGHPELWVRIFPDDISITTFEPQLTDREISATQTYWSELWRAGTSDQKAAQGAWRALARSFGPQRAAYLAQLDALRPTNPEERPPSPSPPGSQPPAAQPQFAEVPAQLRREASWSRAPMALACAEAFTVVLYRDGAEVARATGQPVQQELAVGPNPSATPVLDPSGLKIDEGMRWMIDFDVALAAGMALRIPITAEHRRAGFDRVVVYGLQPKASGPLGSAAFAELLTTHRFSDGLALVPQGSPTKNTPDSGAAFGQTDPDYTRAYELEMGQPLEQSDGLAFSQWLGLPAHTLDHTEHADGTDQQNARQMAIALWPATFGYFLRQMMSGVCSDQQEGEIRDFYLSWVRARGLIPAFRVGDTPYTVVPSTSIERWAADSDLTRGLSGLVRQLLPIWKRSSSGAPHIGRGDPDVDFAQIMGMDASARRYFTRDATGEEFLRAYEDYFQLPHALQPEQLASTAREQLARVGHPEWDPRLLTLALSGTQHRLPCPMVTSGPVSDTARLPAIQMEGGQTGNYISWLRSASIADLRAQSIPGGAPNTLLYLLLRQALLTEYANAGFEILIGESLVSREATLEHELVGFHQEAASRAGTGVGAGGPLGSRVTAWQALDHPLPSSLGSAGTIGSYLETRPDFDRFARLGQLLQALDWLARLSTAELERLVTETLDTFSYRLDPWVNALICEELAHRRTERAHSALPERGAQGGGAIAYEIGAFGWTENLRPRSPAPPVSGRAAEKVAAVERVRNAAMAEAAGTGVREAAGGDVREASGVTTTDTAAMRSPVREPEPDSGGFIHAPSLTQAATGAVLREGYLTHREGSSGAALAIDLSSRRMQIALVLLEGVRQGQPLGALLGYRFERALQAASLDVLVQPFRDRYPVIANKLTQPSAASESVAATNVVDGLALQRDWKAGSIFWTGELAGGEQPEVVEALEDLDDALDAVGDLSLAESVFQVMRGNHERAGGLLDAVSRGERAGDPEVLRTPRGGVDFTHRLAVMIDPGQTRAGGWPAQADARALAEPRLDAWLSTLLPPPSRVSARVGYQSPNGPGELEVTLADLGLGSIQTLELAAAADQPQASELEQRVLYHARRSVPQATELTIAFARDPSWTSAKISFPELLTLARAVRDLLGGVRPLAPEDLVQPGRPAGAPRGSTDLAELGKRAQESVDMLKQRADALVVAATAEELRERLLAAAELGVLGAIPSVAVDSGATAVNALQTQGKGVVKQLRERHEQAVKLDSGFDAGGVAPEAIRDHHLAKLRAVFGKSFLACPLITAPEPQHLSEALATSDSLLAGDEPAPARWLQQLTHLRSAVSRWDGAQTLSALLHDRQLASPTLGQLPLVDKDRWLALALDPNQARPAPGRVAFAAWSGHAAASGVPAVTAPLAGLLLDEWTEQIPGLEESTGVSFHYQAPGSRAPQAVLLAVPPDRRRPLDEETLLEIINETLELAKARAVDRDSLDDLGQLLPAIYLPFNPDGQTVSFLSRLRDLTPSMLSANPSHITP